MLPQLPKQNKQREADFGIVFRHWIMKNKFSFSCAFELKHTRGKDRFSLREFKKEQIAYANAINNDGELIRNDGRNGEADYTWCINMPTYVVIKYPAFFVIINAKILSNEKTKSLSIKRAKEIAMKIVIHT